MNELCKPVKKPKWKLMRQGMRYEGGFPGYIDVEYKDGGYRVIGRDCAYGPFMSLNDAVEFAEELARDARGEEAEKAAAQDQMRKFIEEQNK